MSEYLGKGVYTVPQAARLTGISAQRIHYWHRELASQEGLWKADFKRLEDTVGLSFLDLMELRFINHFRNCGVAWPVIKSAAAAAISLFDKSHPFSNKRFKTDGKSIFAEFLEKGEKHLIQMDKRQFAIKNVVDKELYSGLEFSDAGHVLRWQPSDKLSIVIDPKISFGQPVVMNERIPTDTLFDAWKVEKSFENVAVRFEISLKSVKDAVSFEQQMAT